MTTDMKAAIERVRDRIHSRGLSLDDQMNTILALAEIGRLAVEHHKHMANWDGKRTGEAMDRAMQAGVDLDRAKIAFLARREGGA